MRLFALAFLLLVGCGRCGGSRPARDAGERPIGHMGTIYGTITLAEGATLPRWTLAQIGRAPGQPTLPPECTPPKDADTLPVTATGNMLDGIAVSATGDQEDFFAALPPQTAKDVTVRIEDCRLVPHFLVATVGDTLVIENLTDEPFLPSAGPAPVLETLLFRQNRRVSLEHGGLNAIECRFAHGCGRADLLVLPNPVATVARQGRYELSVPSHMPITIHAWHPLFEESKVVTRVSTGGRVEVNLVLRPAAPRQPRLPRPPLAPVDPNAPVID